MKLDPIRCKQTEYTNTSWTVTVEQGVTLDDVRNPEFFANIAAHMSPYDKIIVRTDDGAWYADLLVLSCGRTWVKTFLMFEANLTTSDVDITQSDMLDKEQGFTIVHRGPHLKFCVIRKSDKAVIRDELETKEQARSWLADYART